MKKIIAASTSTLYKGKYLDYLKPVLEGHFKEVNEILFIPFARPSGLSHDSYTMQVAAFFKTMNIHVSGLHTYQEPQQAIQNAEAIFTGGGNTFLLVKQLHDLKLMSVLRQSILDGTPYLGTSAGSNICGLTMQNTNDMPIVYPSSFKTLGVLPFNINAHYLDPIENSTHMGETREIRIKEFHVFNDTSVLGLREGSWLEVNNNKIILQGELSARVFQQGKAPYEIESGVEVAI